MTSRTWEEQKALEKSLRQEWLKQLAALGLSLKETAEIADMDYSALKRQGKSANIKFTDGRTLNTKRKITRKKLLSCLNAGMTQQEIADTLKCSTSGITQALRREKLSSVGNKKKPYKPPTTLTPLEQMRHDALNAKKRQKRIYK